MSDTLVRGQGRRDIGKHKPPWKWAVIRVFTMLCLTLGLAAAALNADDPQTKRSLYGVAGLVFLPVTLWCSMVARRIIRESDRSDLRVQRLGRVMGFPLAMLGLLFLGIGIVVPPVAIKAICVGLLQDEIAAFDCYRLVVSLILLATPYYLIRAGLGFEERSVTRIRVGVWEMKRLPLAVRSGLFGYLVGLLMEAMLFFSTVSVLGMERAQLVWNPGALAVLLVASVGLGLAFYPRLIRSSSADR